MRPIDADAYADHLEGALKKSILEVDSENVQRFLIATTLTAAVVSDLRDETITPTIDAEPVSHGQWVFSPDHAEGICTMCNFKIYGRPYNNTYLIVPYNYCPNCGAKMDGGKDDGND